MHSITETLERLKIRNNDCEIYCAGLPGFPRNFTRDGIISAIILHNAQILKEQLKFSSILQGKKADPQTGEEPGKIFHEYPGVTLRNGLSTLFNACDTTALFLIGHELYQTWTGDKTLAQTQINEITAAKNYILSHIKDGAFIESPEFSGAKKFALKVTYWKDSDVQNRSDGEPHYPAVFLLAHVQNMRALRSTSLLLKDNSLQEKANEMLKFFQQKLFDQETKEFINFIDQQGSVKNISSDILHALWYLEPSDLSKKMILTIMKTAEALETPAGYRVLSLNDAKSLSNPYHSATIWPFEQAVIHMGAQKFGLDKLQKTTEQIIDYFKDFHEILIQKDELEFGGNAPQLWTVAAADYFQKIQISQIQKAITEH